jgi:hypothetical protein
VKEKLRCQFLLCLFRPSLVTSHQVSTTQSGHKPWTRLIAPFHALDSPRSTRPRAGGELVSIRHPERPAKDVMSGHVSVHHDARVTG